MTRSRLSVAVFASGRGSNFQAILDQADKPDPDFRVVCCVSDRRNAGALDLAAERDIPSVILHPRDFPTEEDYSRILLEKLRTHGADFIALAGFLKKIPASVIEQFKGRIVNVHPSLLPAFGGPGMYGHRVHEAVIEYGVHWTGASVHLVEEVYDTGPIVLQEAVPVLPEDTPDDIAARVLAVEHRLLPETLRLFAQGRVTFEGRRVHIAASQTNIPQTD